MKNNLVKPTLAGNVHIPCPKNTASNNHSTELLAKEPKNIHRCIEKQSNDSHPIHKVLENAIHILKFKMGARYNRRKKRCKIYIGTMVHLVLKLTLVKLHKRTHLNVASTVCKSGLHPTSLNETPSDSLTINKLFWR